MELQLQVKAGIQITSYTRPQQTVEISRCVDYPDSWLQEAFLRSSIAITDNTTDSIMEAHDGGNGAPPNLQERSGGGLDASHLLTTSVDLPRKASPESPKLDFNQDDETPLEPEPILV